MHCKVCKEYGLRWENLHKGKLQARADSQKHIRNVLRQCGLAESHAVNSAPSKDDFLKVWNSSCSGVAPWAGIKGNGVDKKMSSMRSMLAEAIRCSHRDFIRNAGKDAVLALARDDRKSQQCVRFRCVNERLEVRVGLLGWQRSESGCAVTKTALTADTFRKFATPKLTGVADQGVVDSDQKHQVHIHGC